MIRIHRSPDAGDSAGAIAVVEANETAAPVESNDAPEIQMEDQKSKAEPVVEKQKFSEWDRYQKMKERFEKNPNSTPTKAELELFKYNGKDESLIPGFKNSEQPKSKNSEPEVENEKTETKQEVNPLHKLIGAKSDSDILPKVQKLVEELGKAHGEKGEVGRVLEAMGVKDYKEAKTFAQNAKAMHQLFQDAQAGKPEALKFLNIKSGAEQHSFDGEIPSDILDEALYKHTSAKEKAANERADRYERELQSLKADLEPWKQSQAESVRHQEHAVQVNKVASEVQALVESVDGLWDSKTNGSLTKAMNEYYNTTGEYNPGLKPIVEILDIAKSKNGSIDLNDALAIWERKNGGSLIAKAREDARHPFIGKKPSVGLSDQQGSHGAGNYKSYTESSVRDMANGRARIPSEWLDVQGNIMPAKVPQNLRYLIAFEE